MNRGIEDIPGTTMPYGTESKSSSQPGSKIEELLSFGEHHGAEQQDDDLDPGTGAKPETGVQPDDELEEQDGDEPEVDEVEDESDDESDDDGEEEEYLTVTIDGKEQDVPLSELTSGYIRQADYTRKTQELARQREEFEAQRTQSGKEREQYKYLVGALTDKLKAIQGTEEPDWVALATEDPAAYAQQRAAWDMRQRQILAAEAEQQRLAEEDQKEQQRQFQQYMGNQRAALLAAKPELQDQAQMQGFFTSLNNYAKEQYGFTDQELGSVLDHRFMLMAEKAMKFDELQGGKTGGKKVKKTAVKTRRVPLKPGSSQSGKKVTASRRFRNAQERLQRSGSVEDAAALIESLG